MSRSTGRSTRPFRRMRQQTLAESDICIVCGHRASDSVDHIVPIAIAPELAEDPANLGPCHNEPCPTCARRCNNEKGIRSLSEVTALVTTRDWFSEPIKACHRE
jgi:5-methylcytosine-specific restriction endonuclease McrA